MRPAEPVVSIVIIHILDYFIALKTELRFLIADGVILFHMIVKLLDAAI